MVYRMFPNPIHLIRYGSNEPLPEQQRLKAGPLSLILENGTLKYLRVGESEVVRQIYAAVRDESWGTVLPHFSSYTVEDDGDSFRVYFEAIHENDKVDFKWTGTIVGTKDGVIRYSMEGTARRTFLKNRIGFCLLHPMEMAGSQVEVSTPEGTVKGRFPTAISPHQPFMNINSMRQPIRHDLDLELEFEGELFEMEDQRNWTDASFKTYCTPLSLPYPVEIREGEMVKQTVIIRVHPSASATPVSVCSDSQSLTVEVEADSCGRLPDLGLTWPSGFPALGEWETTALSSAGFKHLRVQVNLLQKGWYETLREAALSARKLGKKGVSLEVEAIVGKSGEGVDELVSKVTSEQIPVCRFFIFPEGEDFVTSETVITRAKDAMSKAGLAIPLGGGSRAYFAEFNRGDLPVGMMDVASYPINPQVHAFDNESMMETLAAQAATVQSAKSIVRDIPLSIGPITLKPAFNPAAKNHISNDDYWDTLPEKADVRQMSLLCAGWTVGSIRNLGMAGASAMTYFEPSGVCGILDREIGLYPVYHVFAEIGALAGAELLRVTLNDSLRVEAVAIRDGSRLKVLVANLRNETVDLKLSIPEVSKLSVKLLDEISAVAALAGCECGCYEYERLSDIEIKLLPFAIGILDGHLSQSN